MRGVEKGYGALVKYTSKPLEERPELAPQRTSQPQTMGLPGGRSGNLGVQGGFNDPYAAKWTTWGNH